MTATWVIALILVATIVNVVANINDLGVNWGTLTSHPIHPKIVVQLLKDNGFKKVKLFDSDPRMVGFLAGTGIEVMLGIPEYKLEFLSIDYEYAQEWVKENCTSNLRHGGVDIKYVAVGNEPFLTSYRGRFNKTAFPAMKNIQRALNDEDFAFFDGGYAIQDKNVQYTNVFEANFDTLVYALKTAGTPNLSIIVGEIGWPTDGHKVANKANAKKFYDGLFRVLASDKGTPLRPGEIEVYLFGLFDEDTESIKPGNFERHWGIFGFDGKPKFAMDMSGNGSHMELFRDPDFPSLSGARIVCIATHPSAMRLGYGSAAVELLTRYYEDN
ncbi:hypothetical protein F3Y22_tig00110432pilonHSYRG00005 [Hibiscus syriacus]|uniref:glucan endo-1,3-beta-D-glucosidase n=1 Tax=Hibiscus syriacus TaxID=106335 RepID=A0A6A3ANS4_HIBSY|nr:hypothetical protein F3Y22_tig00110432pilonHSYRG00005 [Hibiscus syriacus]